MNALKNLSLILLLSLAFTGCHNKSSKINDFNLLLYAPEYASGFDIKGAGGKGKRTDNRQESLAGSGQCNHMAVYRPQR